MIPLDKYQEIKSQNPDALLLFRVGDFYELFYEDAKTASKVLGLTLTSRDKTSENPIPMSGFPYHQLDNYLKRLISAGHRAAICELVTDEKQSVFPKRKVTRVIQGRNLNEVTTPVKEPPLLVIQRLIDHACETYPHFESERGERDIAAAREAISSIKDFVGAVITLDAESLSSLGRWRRRLDEINLLCHAFLSPPNTGDTPCPEQLPQPSTTSAESDRPSLPPAKMPRKGSRKR